MQYYWAALPHNTADLPVAEGFVSADNPWPAQQAASPFVRSGTAFLGFVMEIWPEGYQWHGLRTIGGGVRWQPRP